MPLGAAAGERLGAALSQQETDRARMIAAPAASKLDFRLNPTCFTRYGSTPVSRKLEWHRDV